MSTKFNYQYLFFNTLNFVIIAAAAVFFCVCVVVGAYQNYITVSNWWFSFELSMPDIAQISGVAVIAVKILLIVVLLFFFKLLAFNAVRKVFSKFQFKDQSYFDKATSIKYEKTIDQQAINSGFNLLWYSIIGVFASLLTFFLLHTFIFIAVLVVSFGIFIVGLSKIVIGRKPGKEKRILYPKTPEFSLIMTEYSFGTYEDQKELIGRLETLDESIPEYEISRLLIRKIRGENVDLPYDSVGFGEPEEKGIHEAMESIANYEKSDYRVG